MATVNIPAPASTRPKQNWIVDPLSDALLIIAAPIFAFIWALLTLRTFGPETVWSIFIIFNVGHHFPTFVRIYGDKDCFQRFRWSLILGPIIPFTVGLGLSYYTLSHGYPIQTLFLMMMILTLWDPWHFLMQHYGFMRIYDRHNAAPKKLAAWMDYSISLAWFAFIMMATSEWLLEGVLHTLLTESGIPILLWIDPTIYHACVTAALGCALITSAVYLVYNAWCLKRGYYVSPAKLSLLAVTFGVMYITYVPTSWLRTNIPEWQFSTGFAALGMVHVTQYLAIVWKFNRGLAKRGPDRSRAGLFSYAFGKGGLIMAVAYVALCLIYGSLVSTQPEVRETQQGMTMNWLSIFTCFIVTLGFTSTIMHYYYDGFIWKLRHKENSENLNDDPKATTRSTSSWWERMGKATFWQKFKAEAPLPTAIRQTCYFGIPLAFLIVMFLFVGTSPKESGHNPATLTGLQQASQDYQAKPTSENLEVLQNMIRQMDIRIAAEEKMIALSTVNRFKHEVELAYLTFSRAWATMTFEIKTVREPTEAELEEYRQELKKAITLLEKHFDPAAQPIGPMQEEMLLQWREWNQHLRRAT